MYSHKGGRVVRCEPKGVEILKTYRKCESKFKEADGYYFMKGYRGTMKGFNEPLLKGLMSIQKK